MWNYTYIFKQLYIPLIRLGTILEFINSFTHKQETLSLIQNKRKTGLKFPK